jgi:hypothetical protein
MALFFLCAYNIRHACHNSCVFWRKKEQKIQICLQALQRSVFSLVGSICRAAAGYAQAASLNRKMLC